MNKKKYSSIWRVYVSELYRLFHKRSFWLAFMVLFLYAAADYLHTASWIIRGFVKEPYAASGYFMGAYQSFNKYQPIFIKVFPLLMALPCVSAWYEETKRSRNAALVMQRTSPFRYLSAKAMAYFTGNAVMVFVCYALNLLACELTYGEAYPTPFGERYTELYYMALADNHPMPLMGYYVAHTVLYLRQSGCRCRVYVLEGEAPPAVPLRHTRAGDFFKVRVGSPAEAEIEIERLYLQAPELEE